MTNNNHHPLIMSTIFILQFATGAAYNVVICILPVFLLTAPASAQTAPDQINAELQRASILESQKDYDSATRIYRALYKQYPKRIDILMRLEAILSNTGHHAEAVDLLRTRLTDVPNDISARLRIGQAFFALGLPDSGIAHWDRILDNASTSNPFALVADHYRRRNLDDQAAITYRKARTALNNPTLFARELAELAEHRTRYPEAVREYILYLQTNPQYRAMIEARLRDFAQNGNQHAQVFDLLAREAKTHPEDQTRLALLIEYALPAGFAAQALDHVLTSTPANEWIYLSRIAHDALEQNDATTAIAAYRALYDRTDRFDLRARASLGLGQAHELAGQPDEAYRHYRALIDNYADRPEADEARYRLGLILRDHKKEIKKAQQTFQDLIDTNRRNTWRYEALFALAEGHIQTDDQNAAKRAWQQIIAEKNNTPEASKAHFHLAELAFHTGQFEVAKALLDVLLRSDINRDVINDAIALSTLIQEGQRADSTLLRAYADARFKHRQNKNDTALSAYRNLYESNPQSFLADRLLVHQADLLEQQAHYPQAIQPHRKLIATHAWSPFCPASQMTLGNIYDIRLNQYYEAQKAYEVLLTNYPTSLEADLARERLRALQRKIEALEKAKEAG